MKRQILTMKQGTDEWFKARLGRVTSSRFKDVMTKSKTKGQDFGATAISYAHLLIAERFTGSWEEVKGSALEWGSSTESLAVEAYELDTFLEVQQVGFIALGDDIGSSTDGLVGDNGMIEIKCPFASKNHIDYIINGCPKQYIPQIQGGMWVANREWCDFITYDPRFIKDDFKLKVQRIYRDEKYIKQLSERVEMFVEILHEKIEQVQKAFEPALQAVA